MKTLSFIYESQSFHVVSIFLFLIIWPCKSTSINVIKSGKSLFSNKICEFSLYTLKKKNEKHNVVWHLEIVYLPSAI